MKFNISVDTKAAVKSTLTVVLISSICGLSAHLLNTSFWAAFLLATAIQYIVGYVVATYTFTDYKNAVYLAEIEKLEKLSTLLSCAYCDHENVVTFIPNEVPDFKCEKCQNTNNVKLQFTVTRTTSTPPTSFSDILNEPQKNHNINL